MWHCVTVCRGSQSDCKVDLCCRLVYGLKWRLCGQKVRKGRGVLGLARVPKDLEEGQGPCRKKVEGKERGVRARGANTTGGEPPRTHTTGQSNVPTGENRIVHPLKLNYWTSLELQGPMYIP